MPRRARLRFAGVPLHIIRRGNNRIACFLTEDDYRFYLHHLGELAQCFKCGVHAYVLMTNHVHLLVTPHEAYVALGETPEQQAAAYRRLIHLELDDEDLQEIRSAANGGFALGNRVSRPRFLQSWAGVPSG